MFKYYLKIFIFLKIEYIYRKLKKLSEVFMIKDRSIKRVFSMGIGWIIGSIIGLILFALSLFFIEEVGFIIGVSISLGFGTFIGILIENKNYKQLSNDQIREINHLLFSSILLIVFSIIMITYVLIN